jgi:hypothetical protein
MYPEDRPVAHHSHHFHSHPILHLNLEQEDVMSIERFDSKNRRLDAFFKIKLKKEFLETDFFVMPQDLMTFDYLPHALLLLF